MYKKFQEGLHNHLNEKTDSYLNKAIEHKEIGDQQS